MNATFLQTVTSALAPLVDAASGASYADFIDHVDDTADALVVQLVWPYPAGTAETTIRQRVEAALLPARPEVRVLFRRIDGPSQPPVAGVRHVLAVASGKGGVGKSTVAANLAVAMAQQGARTGLLDADIYGPSIGLMLGVPDDKRPDVVERSAMLPIRAHGLQTMSMSYVVTARTPAVWRGPMASGALQQLIGQTRWDDLDVLVVDMPPGTGDIQLTLAQQVALSGAVIVTTPQNVALLDAAKGIEMFRKVDVPILGVVENMSLYRCPACGETSHLFGAGGGGQVAQDYSVPLLGVLPLLAALREAGDDGSPLVVGDADGEIGRLFGDMAQRVLAALGRAELRAPDISIHDD